MRSSLFFSALITLWSGAAWSCPPYQPINEAEVGRYEQVLKSPSASLDDKIFAFGKLKCSDKPHWRTEAMDLMLAQQSRALRGHALSELLLSRDRLLLSFVIPPTGYKKDWILFLEKPNRVANCVSINTVSGVDVNRPCGTHALNVDGTVVRISGDFPGTLHLQPDNSLRGQVLFQNTRQRLDVIVNPMD